MAPIDSDVSDEDLGMAQLTLEPTQDIFEKLEDEKRQGVHFSECCSWTSRRTRKRLDWASYLVWTPLLSS
jgi:hypothetical protein